MVGNAPQNHQCYGQSLTWLIARPLERISPPPFTQFRVLHWAVLVGPPNWGASTMRGIFEALRHPWPGHAQHVSIGTILEIRRDTQTRTSPRFGSFTTHDFLCEFPRSSIAYVGRTAYTSDQAIQIGRPLI